MRICYHIRRRHTYASLPKAGILVTKVLEPLIAPRHLKPINMVKNINKAVMIPVNISGVKYK